MMQLDLTYHKHSKQCTIITTCYNSSQTIKRCIDSVLSQTYNNWELIVVDDASTDNSVDIINEYSDSRIKLIQNEKNLGAGLSRRIGIQNIKSEYMTFLDSDDYLKSDHLETLISYIQKYDVDIISSGYNIIDGDSKCLLDIRIPEKIIETGNEKFKPNAADTKRFMNPMLIKTELWSNVIYSDRRFIEDTPTLAQILYYAKNIMSIPYAGYYYTQNPTSLCHTASDIKYTIFRLLCQKDIFIFFESKNIKISVFNFIKEYRKLLRTRISLEDKKTYSNELKELKAFYKKI